MAVSSRLIVEHLALIKNISTGRIASFVDFFLDSHDSLHIMLAAGRAKFPEIQKDSRCTIGTLAGFIGSSNELQ